MHSLKTIADSTLRSLSTARLLVTHINTLLFFFFTSVVTIFKVVELNRWKILNSVGSLLGLALEIEFYNVKKIY